jgi:hypothetical protein
MQFKKICEFNTEELLEKIKNTKKSFASIIKATQQNPEILNKIDNMISIEFKNRDIIEKLHSIKLEIVSYPTCIVCGNESTYKSKEWSSFCDNNCGYSNRWQNESKESKINIIKKISNTYHNKTEDEKQDIISKRKNTLINKYGVGHNFNMIDFIEKRKQTWIEKYGVEHASKSDIVKEKIIKTNNERFGFNSPTQNKEIKNKSKQTCIKNHGVEWSLQNENIRQKAIATFNKKYGCDHPMQNHEVFNKCVSACYARKEIELNGIIHNVQGYEGVAINHLVSKGIKESSFITSIPEIAKYTGKLWWIDINNKQRRYYPDFYVTETNTIYEIKSEYTYNVGIKDGSLYKKIKTAANIKLLVFDKKGNLKLEI